MFKEKIFKILFPDKAEYIAYCREKIESQNAMKESLSKYITKLEFEIKKPKPTMADLMRDSMGLVMLDFSTADDNGKPPLPYAKLEPDQRKNFITNLEFIYHQDEFNAMYRYCINLFGNHSMLVESDDAVKNGRTAIVALKTFFKQFEDAHAEFLESKKPTEGFDPLATLPE